ncbi:MAG: Flp family type IVb pilin [Proteobacteria bacterium]|nr:Flp family type IVb pilin [Pseudomonadota bacterium]
MPSLKKRLSRLWTDESGISSVEYALLLAFIAGAIIVGAAELGIAVEGQLNDTAVCIDSDGTNC